MPLQDFNFYSLLIPVILLCLSLITFWVAHLKKVADYLIKYAWALALMGVTILLNTILPAELLSTMASLLALMFFLSCSLHTQVLYQRLNVPFSWKICSGLSVLGSCSMLVFSNIFPDQMARIITIAFVTTAIHLHRPIQFFQAPTHFKLDVYLKTLSYVFISIVLARAMFLSFIHDGGGFIAHYAWIWASTQFVIIIFYLIFFALFIASAWCEVMYQLNEERYRDPLTGLLNRRGLDAYIERMKDASQYQHALLMADLDHFKKINDRYGHVIGDYVLQHVSRILKHNVREPDQIARIGGEEFVIVLIDIEKNAAYQIAERIRKVLEQTPYPHLEQQTIEITLSMGLSFFLQPKQIDSALLAADQLLYQAKSMGRNQIQVI